MPGAHRQRAASDADALLQGDQVDALTLPGRLRGIGEREIGAVGHVEPDAGELALHDRVRERRSPDLAKFTALDVRADRDVEQGIAVLEAETRQPPRTA